MARFWRYLLIPLLVLPVLIYFVINPPESPLAPRPEKPVPKVSDEGRMPTDEEMAELMRTDQVTFLMNCIRRYQHDVHGYTLTMQKQERLEGKLYPVELIDVWCRDEPQSVLMVWKKGARKAARVLYVKGENDDQMLVRPAGLLGLLVVSRPVDGTEARQSGRFPINQFGLKMSLERALTSWKNAQDHGALHTSTKGLVQLPEADNQVCYHIHRTSDEPEDDGVVDQTLYIDRHNWLPVAIFARGKNDTLIGEYYFRNIQLNPEFPPNRFTRSALDP